MYKCTNVQMYADDVLVYVPGRLKDAQKMMREIVSEIQQFGFFSGLRINYKKAYLVVCTAGVRLQQLAGFAVVEHLRYLRVQLGNCIAEQAFAPAIAEMKARATFLKTLSLDDAEKACLFKLWVQHVVFLSARVCQPTKSVLELLNLIYRKVLGLHSRMLSPGMVAALLHGGGLNTFPLAVWCRFVFSQMWIIFIHELHRLQGLCAPIAGAVGQCVPRVGPFHRVVADLAFHVFPCMQLGVVQRDKSSLLQRACVTFSKLRKASPVPAATAVPHGMLRWHNVCFS